MPASSSRRRSCSHSSSTAAGSCSTSASSGQVASASPSRIPGRTPGLLRRGGARPDDVVLSWPGGERRRPASGAPARARSAARSANPGMVETGNHGNRCSTRTYVLLSSPGGLSSRIRPYPVRGLPPPTHARRSRSRGPPPRRLRRSRAPGARSLRHLNAVPGVIGEPGRRDSAHLPRRNASRSAHSSRPRRVDEGQPALQLGPADG